MKYSQTSELRHELLCASKINRKVQCDRKVAKRYAYRYAYRYAEGGPKVARRSIGMNYIVITKSSPKFNALLEKLRFSSKNSVNG